MSLTSQSTIDEITITANGIILLRTNNKVLDGTVEIAQSYSRTSLCPGDDLSTQPENVVAIANLTWTSDVISAYKAQMTKQSTMVAQL